MWRMLKLGDICELITKGTTPTSVGFKFQKEGINYVKIESISDNGKFIKSKFAKVNDACHAYLKRSQLAKDDILFSIAGALGRAAIVTSDILPANTNQALAILRLKKELEIDKRYLLYLLNSESTKEQTEANKAGVAQMNLSLSQLKNYTINLPTLAEQQRIVAKLDTAFAEINKAVDLVNKKENEFIKLNSSLLNNEFFEGKYALVNHKMLPLEKCLKKIPSISKIEKKNYLQTGNFPIISQDASLISGYSNNSALVYDLRKAVIVFGDHTRVLKYIDFSFIRGADGTKILLPIDGLESKYLYYLLKYKMPKGVGYARHYSLLKKLQIVIPPLEEQSRIITKLDKCYSEMKIFLEYLKKNKYNYFKLKSVILSKTLEIKTA